MEISGRPNTIDDYLSTLPSDYMQWYTFDNKEATYANLKLLDKVHDSVNDKMIDNPKSLPSESDCTNGLKAMQDAWDLEHTGYKKSRKTKGKVYKPRLPASGGAQIKRFWSRLDLGPSQT